MTNAAAKKKNNNNTKELTDKQAITKTMNGVIYDVGL